MNRTDVEKYLRSAPQNFNARKSEEVAETLKDLKVTAVASGDQDLAKYLWCLQSILEIQDNFIKTFSHFKSQKFYDGWCLLERIEISISSLVHHFSEVSNEYQIALINDLVPKYQSLFPYKVFMSPEILELEKICNICQKPISIRKPCGHRVGEIYNGELCIRVITKSEFLGISTVDSPIQKYSVPFLVDQKTGKSKDHYNYTLVKFLADRLQSPFHPWGVTWTKIRHPHAKFKSVGRNEPCPCESGEKYKKCCLLQKGVLRPHCELSFSVLPPPEFSNFEYND